jgi:hypothetical protein
LDITSVIEEILAEKGKAGITESRDGMKDGEGEGFQPGKILLPAEKKREYSCRLDDERIEKYIPDEVSDILRTSMMISILDDDPFSDRNPFSGN